VTVDKSDDGAKALSEARPAADASSPTRADASAPVADAVPADGRSAASAVERAQRVMDAVKLQIDRGNKVAELRVGEGGDAVRATIRVEQQRVIVHFVAADPAVRARLENSLGTLAKDLSSRGLELDRGASKADATAPRTSTVNASSESRSGSDAGSSGAGAFGRGGRRGDDPRHEADVDDDPPARPRGPHRTFVGRTYMT
jgi:hypothetical protein